jgi:hypothetical protein
MTKLIPLTKGQHAIVDDDVYEHLMQWKWHYRSPGYAGRVTYDQNRKVTLILMHRLIAGTPMGMDTDHIDGNGLHNTRANLRFCTRQQNLQNKRASKDSVSQYKGVSWSKQQQKWQAIIRIEGRNKKLGLFTNEVDAARAYDNAAKKHHGDFARLNLPTPEPAAAK